MTAVPVNGGVSFWWRQHGRAASRPALPGPTDADVCVVGAGYTGLWTARRLQAALDGAVDDVVAVAVAEGIDADVVRGGELTVATTDAHRRRLEGSTRAEQRWAAQHGADTGLALLDAGAVRARVAVDGARGGAWHPHAARMQPAKLVAGLAGAVEARGVTIHEDTAVTAIAPGRVETARGAVSARFVVRATEGFTARLPGERRTWLPMNSSMVVTAPLPAAVWDALGWAGRQVLGDAAHAYVYAQRTADDRIAIGGRGVPYRFGSRHDVDGATPDATMAALVAALERLFPVTRGVTALTALPWVNHRVRRWEPEPLRWLGVRALYAAYRAADRAERRRATTSPLARMADRVSGRY